MKMNLKDMQTIPIYIISLRRTPERRLHIQRQLDAFKLKYQWIEAVDAYDFEESELQVLNLENPYHRNNVDRLSTLGCLLSHIKFYDQVIKNNHEIACVLEDDAQLLPSFLNVLNAGKLQNEKWGILLLAHQSGTVGELLRSYYKYNYNKIKRKQRIHYDRYTLGALPGNFSKKICEGHYIAKTTELTKSTMGYLVRLSAAKKLRETALAYKGYVYIDDITGDKHVSKVTTKLITPPCIRLNRTYLKYSTIQPLTHFQASSKLPHEKLLSFFMRNKWTTIIMQLAMCKKIKLMIKFSIILILFEWNRMKKYLIPNKRHGERVLLAKKYHIAK